MDNQDISGGEAWTEGPSAEMASRIRSFAHRIIVDVSPLQESRDFRLLFTGQVVSQIGNQVRMVALPYQVFLLTHSSAMVGLLSLVQFVPLVGFSLAGGTLADMKDRRRILFVTQSGLTVTSALLALAAITGHAPVWYLFAVAAVAAGLFAFDGPTQRAAIPRMVPRAQLGAALALNQVITQLSNVLGPALGGLVVARAGLGPAYALDAASFLVVLATLFGIAPMPPEAARSRRGQSWLRQVIESISEGITYLKGRPVLLSAFLTDLNATFFGGPKALFPALATDVFRTGPAGLGLLYSSLSAGALGSALASGWLGRVRHQGQAVICAVVVWGLSIAAFGLLPGPFWLALALLALAGAADMVSVILRHTILQATVPDRLRGRLSAIHMVFAEGGPRLGELESGAVAQLTTVQFSVVSGGVAAAVGAIVIMFALPAFTRYDALRLEEA